MGRQSSRLSSRFPPSSMQAVNISQFACSLQVAMHVKSFTHRTTWNIPVSDCITIDHLSSLHQEYVFFKIKHGHCLRWHKVTEARISCHWIWNIISPVNEQIARRYSEILVAEMRLQWHEMKERWNEAALSKLKHHQNPGPLHLIATKVPSRDNSQQRQEQEQQEQGN